MSDSDPRVLLPHGQIRFWDRLNELREHCLGPALQATMRALAVAAVDAELHEYVPAATLTKVAAWGLRGELLFAVPAVLLARPALLGYYRLLYGLSQNACYAAHGPLRGCLCMEERNRLPREAPTRVLEVCRSLAQTGTYLVDHVGRISAGSVHELQLMTVGAMLDGTERNLVGQRAVNEFWQVLRGLVRPYFVSETARELVILNAAGRTVRIVLADDPDVTVIETFSGGTPAPRLSIEVKGGKDRSNVHNRLGEAEKSHQKAKAAGFRDCWTVLNAAVPEELARTESPTTGMFFQLSELLTPSSPGYITFRDHLCAILSLPDPPPAG